MITPEKVFATLYDAQEGSSAISDFFVEYYITLDKYDPRALELTRKFIADLAILVTGYDAAMREEFPYDEDNSE